MARMIKDPQAPQFIIDIAKKHFSCNCDEMYLSRGLAAPDCPYHSFDWVEFAIEISETESTPTHGRTAEEILKDNIGHLKIFRKRIPINDEEARQLKDGIIKAMHDFRTKPQQVREEVRAEDMEKQAEQWADECYERDDISETEMSYKDLWDNRKHNFIEGAKWMQSHPVNTGDGWVKVEGGLPELRKPVLVFMSYGEIDTCYWNGELWVQSIRQQHSNGSVTHWQPLPLPPVQ